MVNPKYAQAWKCYESGDYEQAINLFNKYIEKEPEKQAYYLLANVYIAKNNMIMATQLLLEAIKLDRFYHEALVLLGDIYSANNRQMNAMEFYAQAVSIQPDNEEYKQKLVNIVGSISFKKTNPNLKGVLIECLESDEIELLHMGSSWLSIIKHDANVGFYYKYAKSVTYQAFRVSMDGANNCDGLIDPFFLTGLGKFIVSNLVFEKWIAYLRRYMLENMSNRNKLFSDPEDIEMLCCAISRYCFLTDYILPESDEETKAVEELKGIIDAAKDKPDLASLACYACYRPIYMLEHARGIAASLKGGNHVSQIPKKQIEDFLEQQEIKNSIETIGSIKDCTSKAVQAQYEEFPYPRWGACAKDLFTPEIEGHLKGKCANILIAGCGTGKESIQMAYVFPDAKITAIDLSKTSLSYAIFKARSLGISNITFKQADIMELDFEEGRFDYIASAGVLHHMQNPKAGFEVLHKLLKDDGLMRIGLYSRQARWAINDARKAIEDNKIGSDGESIKLFRKKISKYIKIKSINNLEGLYDYYNLPECRDLLFHVKEHQYDLLQVKDLLDEFDMEILQFYLARKIKEKYVRQNKFDPDVIDLESLAKWESKNPDTFISMYMFWCRKNSRH